MATTVPNITFSCHMTVSEVAKKREVKASSYHLSLLEREQRFSQKPQHIIPSVLLAESSYLINSGCKKGLREKSRASFCLTLGSGLCQVGMARCLCLSTKPGGEGCLNKPSQWWKVCQLALRNLITNCNLYLSLWFRENTKGLTADSERQDTKAGSFVLFLLSKDSYEACLLMAAYSLYFKCSQVSLMYC